MRHLFLTFICFALAKCANAQCTIYQQKNFSVQSKNLGWGHHSLIGSDNKISSVQLEEGAIAIFFEMGTDDTPSGKYVIVSTSNSNLIIGFKPAHVLIMNNPGDEYVVAFEHSDFKGKSYMLPENISEIPENIGISSLYVPKRKKVSISSLHPDLRADHAGPSQLFEAGVHFYVGDIINDMKGFTNVSSVNPDVSRMLSAPVKLLNTVNTLMDQKAKEFKSQLGNPFAGSSITELGLGDWNYRLYNRGIVYGSSEKVIFALFGNIFLEYAKNQSGPHGKLGFPISDIIENDYYRIGLFENGTIVENIATSNIQVFYVKGAK